MQRPSPSSALAPGAGARLAEGVDHLLVGPAGRRAAADDAPDVVLGHEVERPRARADHRLPALDRQRLRPRHQRDLLELVASVGHPRRDRVVLALVREGALVERLEDEVDLLLEQLAVGVLIEHRRPERLDLAGVVAAPDPEHDPAVGQPVDGGEVLGHPDRVPHRRDVEAAADADVLREVAEVQGQHQHVRDALVAFALEVVLGQPEDVVAGPVHQLRDGLALRKHRRQVLVGEPAIVRGRAVEPLVVQIHVAREQAAEARDHDGPRQVRLYAPEPYHTRHDQLNRFGLNRLSRTIVGMKRALAALLGVLVLLGASLYLFVVRPLLRPADMTAAAESALAMEDLLLLGGINVKQAVFLERWFLGTPPISTVADGDDARGGGPHALRSPARGGGGCTHDVDHALYAVYPAAAESTRHAVVLLGRFNPPAINGYLTRELQATPRAGAGPASYEVVRTDPTTCRPGATWIVTVAPGVDCPGGSRLAPRAAVSPREPAAGEAGAARLVAVPRARGRGRRGDHEPGPARDRRLPAVREELGEGPGHRRRRLRARVRGARGEAGAAAGRAPRRDRREGRRPWRGAAQGLGAGGERLPRALAGQHAQRGRPPRQPEGSRRRLPEHHRVHRRPHPRRKLPARGQRAPGGRAGRLRRARRRARRGAAGRADRHRALAVRALARAAVAARLRSAGELRRGGGPDPGARSGSGSARFA